MPTYFMHHTTFRPRPLHAAVLTLMLAIGSAATSANTPADALTQWLPAAHAQSAPQSGRLPDFTHLAEEVGASVVNIRTKVRGRTGARGMDGFEGMDEEMLEFLRRFGFPVPGVPRSGRNAPEREERNGGVGSGFILSHDGFIMTNAHVVDRASEVIVTLSDQREFTARIVGTDRRTDVAVLKIDAQGLPAVRIGNVERLKVGEWVMAIGSPFGLENTVTAGIVSAKQRDTGDYLPFIQTDVAINPGNSGGPLLNLAGEVVGINSQIYSRSGGFMGISFAIPIDEAMRVSDQLRSTGRVTRGRIGVRISEVSKEVGASLGLGDKPYGALVGGVEPDSPAEHAGLEAGDIIVGFEGRRIEKFADLPRLIGNTPPGQRATITVLRQGKTRDLRITIAEVQPDENSQQANANDRQDEGRSSPPGTASAPTLGLVVREMSATQKKQLGVSSGVQVLSVRQPAAQAGVREGDVLLSIAQIPVQDLHSFRAALKKLDSDRPIPVLVRRDDWAQYLLIQPGK